MEAFATKVKLIKQAQACGDYAVMNLHDRDIQRVARREALAEGMEKGQQQKAIEAAEKLLQMNVLSFEQIMQATSLPLEQVQELSERLCVNPSS